MICTQQVVQLSLTLLLEKRSIAHVAGELGSGIGASISHRRCLASSISSQRFNFHCSVFTNNTRSIPTGPTPYFALLPNILYSLYFVFYKELTKYPNSWSEHSRYDFAHRYGTSSTMAMSLCSVSLFSYFHLNFIRIRYLRLNIDRVISTSYEKNLSRLCMNLRKYSLAIYFEIKHSV